MQNQVWIIDFGSQYTQLITRKIRELGYSAIIYSVEETAELIKQNHKPNAFVLSGGPQSIFEDKDDYNFLLNSQTPVLGICYGMQILAHYLGGKVERGTQGEYGQVEVNFFKKIPGVPDKSKMWMSHFDQVTKLPNGFELLAKSDFGSIAAIVNLKDKKLGLQFHPEVHHSEHGMDVLKYFLKDLAGLKIDWTEKNQLEEALKEVSQVKDKKILCAFSGGVDSLVAASLVHQVAAQNIFCFFVDHGLLRPQDLTHIQTLKEKSGLNIEIIDAKDEFLSKLNGVSDPEKKRKIIGNTFIEVFEKKVHLYEQTKNIKFEYLLQGTLYPDIIESSGISLKKGKAHVIKSHHNVGGLPEKMNLKLLEPLKFMFKDEVRKIGLSLKLDRNWVFRHPFPGPGLGVRALGEVTNEKLRQLKESDQILFEEMNNFGIYDSIWQAFVVHLPIKTVGVKGDERAFQEVMCVRLVQSTDGMTAHFIRPSWDFLAQVSARITNEVQGITRVVYDITNKPPGTIEWE